MKLKSLLFCALLGSAFSSASAETVIKILHIQSNPKIREIWQQAAQKFESAHPGVKVQFDWLNPGKIRIYPAARCSNINPCCARHVNFDRVGQQLRHERRNRSLRRRGSGGDGRHRGGDGVIRELEALAPLRYSLITERRRHAPSGADGGEDGEPGRNLLDGTPLPPKSIGDLKAGQRLRIETPGGGGYGAPERRGDRAADTEDPSEG